MSDVGVRVRITRDPQSKQDLQGTAGDLSEILDLLKKLDKPSLDKLSGSTRKLGEENKKTSTSLNDMAREATKAESSLSYLESMITRVWEGTKFLGGEFLALEGVRFFKELADEAAQTEKFSIALEAVGKNAGYSAEQLEYVTKGLEAHNISASDARESLTKYIQANLNLADATKVATVAQNLSVISNQTVSDSFQMIMFALQSGRTEMLRRQGLIVDQKAAEDAYAKSLGTTASALTQVQKNQAILNGVIEAGERISGTYAAAQSTAGQEVMDLKTVQENLKDSLGQGLLPAYAEIVGVIKEMMTEMGLAADQQGKESEGAKDLAKDIHYLAEAIKVVTEFAIKHREAILTVATAYVLAKGVLNPLSSLIGDLAERLPAIGKALGGAAGKLGDLGTAAKTSSAEVETFAGVEGEAAAAGTGFAGSLGAIALGFTATVLPMAVFAGHVVELIKSMNDLEDLNDRIKGSTPQAIAAAEKNMGKVSAWAKIKAGFIDSLTFGTTRESDILKKALDEAQQSSGASAGSGGGNPGTTAHLTPAQQAAQDAKAVQTAQEQLFKTDTFGAGGMQSGEFLGSMASFNTLLGDYTKNGKAALTTTDELKEGIKKLGQEAKTPADLKALRDVVAGLSGTGAAGEAHTALALAAEKVRKSQEGYTAPLDNEAKAAAKNQADKLVTDLNTRLELLKNANAAVEVVEKAAFQQGIVGLDQYYADRKLRMQSQYQAETALSMAHEKALRAELAHTRDPNQRGAIQNQIEAEIGKRAVAAQTGANAISGLDTEKATALDTIQDQMVGLSAQADKYFKGEIGTVEEITKKYDELAKKLHGVAGAQEIIARAKTAEVMKAGFDSQNADLKTYTDYQSAQLDLQKAQAAYRQKESRGTAYNPVDLNNQEVAQQKQVVQEQLDAVQQHIATLSNARQTMIGNGASNSDVAGLTSQIVGLETEVTKLKTSFVNLDAQVQHAGDALENAFQTNVKSFFNTFLSANWSGNKDAHSEFPVHQLFEEQLGKLESFGASLQSQVAGHVSDMLSKSLTAKIGTGPFSAISKYFGGSHDDKAKITDGAMHTIVDNLTEIAGGASPLRGLSGGAPPAGVNVSSWADSMQSGLGSLPGISSAGGATKDLMGLFSMGKSIAGSFNNPLASIFSTAKSPSGLSTTDPSLTDLIPGLSGGGSVRGPGSGTSDSVHVRLSNGEHVTKAAQAKKWMPVLSAINNGSMDHMQSIAGPSSLAAPGFADGGVVGGSGSPVRVGGNHTMQVQLHPDALSTSMGDWLQSEVTREYANR